MSAKRDEATRELDARIAVDVMGWTLTAPIQEGCDHAVGTHRDGSSAKRNFVRDATGKERVIPLFSSEIASAWLVVEKMRADGYRVRVQDELPGEPGGEWFAGFDSDELEIDENSYGDSAPHAICLAALKAAAALSERAS